jgi:hypothetical protein
MKTLMLFLFAFALRAVVKEPVIEVAEAADADAE